MDIGIEGDGEKCYIVVQFDDGQRAVKGPMDEDEAKLWIDGMLTEMKEEGFESSSSVPRGSQLPQGTIWVGSVVTFAILIYLVLWLAR